MNFNTLKNYSIGLIFILSFGISSFAQEINLSENKVEQLICKTWKIDRTNDAGKNIEGVENEMNATYVFKPENTFIFKNEKYETLSGNWEYKADENFILIKINGIDIGKIISLKKTEMVLRPRAKPKMKFYLKPVE
jgi:hypothetical protein